MHFLVRLAFHIKVVFKTLIYVLLCFYDSKLLVILLRFISIAVHSR
jgi:hypothetical protein